jgi:ribosomal protein S18 acetylase RimI-like enzyme
MTDQTDIDIRPTVAGDVPALQVVLDGTELFPSGMLPDMLAGFLGEAPSDIWLTAHDGGGPVGLCFAAPEQLAEGTWTMRALAVLPARQGRGIGAAMTVRLEGMLKERGGRILIVDTSGTDGFALTRAFYAGRGYQPEARIRDYWADGDDKVTFRKRVI